MLSVDSRLPVDSLLVLCCWLPLPVTWLLCLPVLWDCLLSPYRPLERKLNIIQCLKGEAEWREQTNQDPIFPFLWGEPRHWRFHSDFGGRVWKEPKSQTESLGKDNSHMMRSTSNACTMPSMAPEAVENTSLNVNYLKCYFKPKRVCAQLVKVRRRNTRTQGRKKYL